MTPKKIVLLACGSYNPPTFMHLRMFEVARDHLNRVGQYEVVGGVISPVHDAYGKKDLEASSHRLEMLKLSLNTSDWIKVSDWEIEQENWSRTLQVLQYHQNTLNSYVYSNHINQRNELDPVPKWIPDAIRGCDDPITVKLLCGGDLLETFSVPGLWKESDIDTIVGQHGLVVITREGTNPLKFVYESDQLTRHMRSITMATEWITNDVSSTKIRRALRRHESVRYLIPDAVVDYITKTGLYGACTTSESTKFRDKEDFLNIPLNLLTPSPSDVNMKSVSPSRADQDINLSLAPIDEPDASNHHSEKRAFFKNDTEVVYYEGRNARVQSVEENPTKMKKVGFVDESPQKIIYRSEHENLEKVVTCFKQTPEVQVVVLEQQSQSKPKETSPKKMKKPPRLSDPTRSRNVFKRSNSDVPTSQSTSDLAATAVKIEFTKEGIKVISDKESMV